MRTSSPSPGVVGWLDARLPVRKFWAAFVAERIPGGARWAYVFGSLCLALLVVQFLTGTAIALWYVPAPNAALASITYLSDQVTFGRVVLGIHHWSANILVGAVLLHVGQTFVYGAYKKPREVVWLSGVVLLLLVQAFHFSGFVLPWDQKGYWATEVGTSIIRATPLAGNLLSRVIRGGKELGAVTLSHFYAVHVLVLPAMVIGFAALHIVSLRCVGPAGSWRAPNAAAGRRQFFPHQMLKDAVSVAMLIAIVAALAICEYTPPASVADPTDTSFLPRPEWNFLFLYQLQRYLPGSIEAVGTTLIPGLLVLLLIALPFLDRGQLRTPSGRLGFLLGGTLIAALVVGLTVLAVMSDAATWEYVTHPVVREGAHLYAENDCGSCHRIRGEGASSAPDLSFIGQLREREWLRTYVRDPDSLNPATAMPPYTRLSATELDAIASYLKSLR